MQSSKHNRKVWLKRSVIILVLLGLTISFAYAYEAPGGIADWRHSRAIEYPGTLRIPIGKTPEEAVEKFRNTSMQVVFLEPIEEGVLLFLRKNGQKESTKLQIEYVRKTWLNGWKWVMGGGYSLSRKSDSTEALNFMSIPNAIHGPFPIIFGNVINSTISTVTVTIGGDVSGKYSAKIIEDRFGQRLWYVVLPTSADAPYEIEALDGEGTIVANKSFDDSREFASILMSY